MTPLLLLVPSVLAAPTLSAPSLLPGDDAIGPSAGDQWNPVLVRGDGDYLLVWEDARATLADILGNSGTTDSPDLYGIRLDADGFAIDEVAFPIATGPWTETAPRAAYSNGQWLVAYQADAATTWYFSQGVYAKRVDAATGAVLDADPIVVVQAEDDEEYLQDVAGDGSDFAVLWQEVDGASWVLDGAVIGAGGASGGAVRVYTPSSNTYAPWNSRLAWNTDRYLIGWEALGTGSSWDIQGLLVDDTLTALGSPIAITDDASSDGEVAIGTNDDGFYMAWQDDGVGGYWTEIQGTPVSSSGVPLIEDGANLSDEVYPASAWPDVAWTGSNWAVSWMHSGAFTTLVETSGDVAEIVDVSGLDYTVPTVTNADGDGVALTAWGSASTIDGWSQGYDVETTAVEDDGSVPTPEIASIGAPAQTHPDIAGDSGGYLVVAQSETGDDSRIVAWTLSRRGLPTGAAPIEIARGSGEIQDPAVAWNGDAYLVVWEEYNSGGTSSQIWGVRVDRSGTVMDTTPVAIMKGNDPAVAASGSDFLVVDTFEVRHEQREIDAVRVGSDGSVVDTTPIVLGSSYATKPDVTGTSEGWMAAWQHASTHDSPYHAVRAASLDTSGGATSEVDVASASSTALQVDASVASDGTDALVTFSDDGNVRGRFLSADGVPSGSTIAISTRPNSQFETAAAWNGRAYQVTWTDFRRHAEIEPGEGDVYTTTVSTAGVVGNRAGLAVAVDANAPEGNAVVAGANGVSVFAWTMLHDESPYAAYRLETANLAPTRP